MKQMMVSMEVFPTDILDRKLSSYFDIEELKGYHCSFHQNVRNAQHFPKN